MTPERYHSLLLNLNLNYEKLSCKAMKASQVLQIFSIKSSYRLRQI